MRQRGFSLLEMVIATLVASVVLLLIAQLLLASARIAKREDQAVVGRGLDTALRALSSDLRSATEISPAYGPLGGAPLTLFTTQGIIEWQIVGNRLERKARSDGQETIRRYLPGIQRLRWEQTWRRTIATEIQPGNGDWVRIEVGLRARRQRSF